jgi:phage RecT family recombinase
MSTTTAMIPHLPEPTGMPEQIGKAFTAAMETMCKFIAEPTFQARFAQLILTQLIQKPALQACTPESFFDAVVQIAESGLDPSAMNEVFLVPYNNEVTVQLGYGGLAKLACAHPDVLDVFADEVCANDTYEFCGVERRPTHGYPASFQPRGRHIGYYAVALLRDGRIRAVQMSVEEVKAHAKQYSRNADKKVWSDGSGGGFRGMAMKTVLRKICNPKYIPVAGHVAALFAALEAGEEGPATRVPSAEVGTPLQALSAHLFGDTTQDTALQVPYNAKVETSPSGEVQTPEQPLNDPGGIQELLRAITEFVEQSGRHSGNYWKRTCNRFHLARPEEFSRDQLDGLLIEAQDHLGGQRPSAKGTQDNEEVL